MLEQIGEYRGPLEAYLARRLDNRDAVRFYPLVEQYRDVPRSQWRAAAIEAARWCEGKRPREGFNGGRELPSPPLVPGTRRTGPAGSPEGGRVL